MTDINRRKRRSNAEILEDLKRERVERAAVQKAATSKRKASGQKRVRRTKAQIEADTRAELVARELLAQEKAAQIPAPKVPKFKRTIYFVADGITALGEVWESGDVVTVVEGGQYYDSAFRDDGSFVLDLSPEQQLARWGHVKYYQEQLPDAPVKGSQSTAAAQNKSTDVTFATATPFNAQPIPVDENGIRLNPTFSPGGIVHPDEEYAHLYDDSDLPEDDEE
jgi:hypothetical protein